MGISPARLLLCLALGAQAFCARIAPAQSPPTVPALPARAQVGSTNALRQMQNQLYMLTNQARAAAGVRPVQWDSELAAAALNHCIRMAAEGSISHRYRSESDLSERAALAGAHFSFIAENVAFGPYAASIHQGWLNSPGHRANMLDAEVDSVGIAVVAGRGGIYAVVDFSRAVPVYSPRQAEDAVAWLLHSKGLEVLSDRNTARAVCGMDHGLPQTPSGPQPGFLIRWQGADLAHLPASLLDRIASGNYPRAAVGNCPAQRVEGSFTAYRMAVLLYGPASPDEFKSTY